VSAPCPSAIEFGLDEEGDARYLTCTLGAGHRDPHMARFKDAWGVIGGAEVPATGLIRWEELP
jgi:hypothetical protein